MSAGIRWCMLGYDNFHCVYNSLKWSKYLGNFFEPHCVIYTMKMLVIGTLHLNLLDSFNWAKGIIICVAVVSQ